MKDLYVTFLKSEHGTGYTATIRHDLAKRNWNANYGHLKGTAKNFKPETEFEIETKLQLALQGVTFVN